MEILKIYLDSRPDSSDKEFNMTPLLTVSL